MKVAMPGMLALAALAGCASAPAARPRTEEPLPKSGYAVRLEDAGRWREALEVWRSFNTYDGCGNCRISKERRRREGLYRCLMALGRFEEAYRLCLEAWLSPRLMEDGEGFLDDLVLAAHLAGRADELRRLASEGTRHFSFEILDCLRDP